MVLYHGLSYVIPWAQTPRTTFKPLWCCFFPHTNASVTATVDLWPSSTRAGLTAIFLALLIIPSKNTLRIYSDSQAAINSVTRILSQRFTPRVTLKTPNNLLLLKIKILIEQKDISLFLIKVKAHMGIPENEKADKQVKFRTERGHFFINSCSHLDTSFRYFPTFGNFPVE